MSSVCRLYKEALKQAAVDPSTGKIDITILTTGISGAARKRKAEVASALKNIIQEKGKIPTLKYQKLYEEFREKSDFVSTLFLSFLQNGRERGLLPCSPFVQNGWGITSEWLGNDF